MKTSFKDFAENAKDQINGKKDFGEEYTSLINKSGFTRYFTNRLELKCWVDVEKEIKKILECIDAFIKNIKHHANSSNNYLNDLDAYTKTVLVFMGMAEKDNRLTKICSEYYDKTYGIKEEKIIECMENQLNSFINCFEYYLDKIMPQISETPEPIKKIMELDPQYVLSFNYTDTYAYYGIDKSRVTHVHGEIGNNNIVLGIDDDEIIGSNYLAFKKYYQVIQKENQRIDFGSIRKLLGFEGMWTFNVYYYGHSLDVTDAELIHEIKNNSDKMKIFYYCEEDRNEKLKNIIRVFGKRDALNYLERGVIELIQI